MVEKLTHASGTEGIEPYDPGEWLSETIDKNGLNKDFVITYQVKKDFREICKVVQQEMDKVYNMEEKSTKDKESEWLNRQHLAVIGNTSAMAYFITRINEVLRAKNITSTNYPSYYVNLAEAIFHEVWGVSVLHKWEKYPESEAAVIRGTELWIDINGKFVKQKEEFASEEVVEHVKKTFTLRAKDALINEQHPELEIEREDGSRITMIQKPRSRENYVMFRRFIIKDISLEEQSRLDTIPQQDVPIYSALSRTMPNIIIAGRVRSAKSTFMKSMIRERDKEQVIAVLEKHFELGLSKHLPDRLIFEVQAKEGDLHSSIPRLLRMEHDYIVIGEIRSIETEGFLQACERGERGTMSTYHLTDEKHAAKQITRHVLDEYPNRNFANELERVARNIDIIITMDTDNRNRTKKRVTGVTEVIWDDDNDRYYTTDLIRYSKKTNKYYYNHKISNTLLRKMIDENEEETRKLVTLLKKREVQSPISEYNKMEGNMMDFLLEVEGND